MRKTRWGQVVVFGIAFVAVHAVLWYLAKHAPNQPLGDVVTSYRAWIEQGRTTGFWVGIDSDWVYPIVALVPMAIASVGGPAHVAGGWLLLMVVLDAVACVALWRHRAFGVRVVWWWLVFLLALGPISLGRIDTVATAVALVGVAVVARRPAVASVLFTVGAWIKVWPAALVGVLLLLRRHHRVGVFAGALVTTALVVLVDVLYGGAAHLFSFIGQQTGRALQIEAPLATPFMWLAAARVPGFAVYWDPQIITYEVSGRATHAAAAVSTPLMALVVVGGVVLALVAVRRGAIRAEVAPVLAMLLVTTLLVTNKVGSPQYIGWFAVPIVWGLVAGRASARRFAPVAVAAFPLAVLTQVFYPYVYNQLTAAEPWVVAVLSARNVLEGALLVWAVVALVRVGNAGARRAAAEAARAEAEVGRASGSVAPGVRDTSVRGNMDA